MKRIISICLLLCMVLSFTACNKEKNEDATTTTQKVATTEKETKNEETSESTTVEEKTTVNSQSNTTKSVATTTTTKATTTTTKAKETTTEKASGAFGSFSAKDLNGNKVTQSAIMGSKLTLVNIWATWCGYCKAEMPYIEQCSKTYASQGFKVVGIVYNYSSYGSVDQSTAKSIVSSYGLTYTNIVADTDSSLNKICDNLCASGVPVSVFVDSNGNQVGEPIIGAYTSQENWNYVVEYYLGLV